MGQVSVTLNDRVYRLVCDDGEEDRLVELAQYLKSKVSQLTAELGHAGDERLILMAALMIADELWDARAKLEAFSTPAPAFERGADSGNTPDPEPVRRLKNLASRMAAGGAEAAEAPAKPMAGPKKRDIA